MTSPVDASEVFTAAPGISPTLRTGETAYELKFTLDPALGTVVEEWARRHLQPDPHGDPTRGGAYRIHGVYLDTPGLDVFHRMPSFRRRKYRLRRYGDESCVYLERKTRRGDRVRKRRCVIPAEEMPLLTTPEVSLDWAGEWFHRRVAERGLRPTLAVRYERLAFLGAGDGSRLTLDRDVRCESASAWGLPAACNGLRLLGERVILELKYQTTLPLPFRRLLQEAGLCPAGVSKYRLGVEACGLVRGNSDGGVVD